jgi:hypothetical protein
MSATIEQVTISDCEYDCWLCKRVHRYTDADGLYSVHMDLRIGSKRWSFVEAEG